MIKNCSHTTGKKALLLSFLFLLIGVVGMAQTTPIPDTNFEQYLVDEGIDTNGLNGNILNTDAEAVTVLDININTITDFTGLEAFVNLMTLDAGTNQFPTLPLTTLTALENLTLEENVVLASLDFSTNTQLKTVRLRANGGNNAAPITLIDFSANTLLEVINIYNFKLLENVIFPDTDTVVDLYLLMFNDIIVDFSGYDNLEVLALSTNFNNTIPIIATLPTNQNTLRRVSFQGGNIVNVDLSNFLALEYISLQNTNTEILDIPITPTLTDIRISNHRIDAISFENASALTNLSIVNKQGVPPLQLDITQNVLLEDLTASNNLMNNIDLSQNIILDRLRLDNNDFTTVDISTNVALESVDISQNQLPTLDTQTNTLLETLDLEQNLLTSLDLTTNTALRRLYVTDNMLPGTDLSQNSELQIIRASFNEITALDISFNDKLTDLTINNNLLTGNDIITAYHQNYFDSGRLLGRGDQLIVFNNMLSGTIPDFGPLVKNTIPDGLPSDTQSFGFRFENNAFHFGDFENEHSAYVQYGVTQTAYQFASGPFFSLYHYAPQAKVDDIENITRNAGDNIVLTCEVRGSQNHYKWFKDGVEIPNAPDSPELILSDLNSCDQAVYHTEVTSDLVPFENSNPPSTGGKNLLLIRNDITLTVDFTPSCVVLETPMNAVTDVPINTGITWSNSPGACEYIVSIGTTAGGTQIVNQENVGDVLTYNFAGNLPPNDELFVTVVAIYRDGSQSTCDAGSFTTSGITGPAGCVSLTYPFDGATEVQPDTNFSWEISNGADGYFLNVGTSTGGTDILDMEDVGDVTIYDLPIDLPDGVMIYVTLIPYNEFGNSNACAEVSFTTKNTATTPACTSLSLPINGATDVLIDTNLSWTTSPTADGYLLSVGTTSGGTDIINNQDVGNVTTFDLPTDLPEFTEIFVTIIPYNISGNATGCTEESFTTELFIPDCVTLSDPLNGATDVLIGTDLSWTTAATAEGYIVSVGTTSGGTDIINNQDVGNVTTFDLPTDLPEFTEIFVTIIPYNATGDATGCTEESFMTELFVPDCVTLTNPLNGATNVLIGTDLSWTTSPTADGYLLSVGTTSGGTDIINNQDLGNVTTFDLPTDLPEFTEIFVTIIPYNISGNATGCTEESFMTELFVPDCVTLTNPLNGATNVLIGTDLSWTTSPTADGYLLSVGTTSGGTDIINNQDVGNVTTFDLPIDLPEFTEIFVTIIPYNATGDATGCTEESFMTELFVPDCVMVIDPLNGATDVLIDTNLSWTTSPTAEGYIISVGTTSGGTDIINNQDVGNVTTFDLPTDLPEFTEIFVTIIPYNATGNATGCSEESFTSQLFIPDCVTLTDPLNGATGVLIGTDLSWTTAATAEGYIISIGTTSGGTDIINNQDVGNVTTFDLPTDLPDQSEIFVTIIPYNATGNAQNCGEESFITQTFPPPCTLITNPLDGTIDVPVTTTITWEEVIEATGYLITIGTTSGGTDIANNLDIGNSTSYTPPINLPQQSELFVTITPYNSGGNAQGCTEISFITELLPPDCTTLFSPSNGSTNVAVNTGISWNPVQGADGYFITVATFPGGDDIIATTDVGNITEISLAEELPDNTTMYVTIHPYNAGGITETCPEESFTTEENTIEIDNSQKFGFSPDGDGINEFWEIKGIRNYPDNVVSIYNRWGDLVFEIKGYDNASNVFRGSANRATARGAEDLPEGTYFFTIDIPVPHPLKTKGYVVLKR